MTEDIKTSTKWIIAISWIVFLFIGIVVFQNLSRESAETDRQYYLEMAREYETKAATEYKLFEEYSERASGILREWMSTDQREDYERQSTAASYHFDKYCEYNALAEQYRNLAQHK